MLIFTAGVSAAESRTVLSANRFWQADFDEYKKHGVDLIIADTGASYTWTEDSNWLVKETDTEFNAQEMRGGNITFHDGNVSVNSSYEGCTPCCAIFDLKKVYSVDRVDVWSHSTSYAQVGKIEIKVSEDGINYTDAGSFEASVPEGDSSKWVGCFTVCEFEKVNARYVSITIDKAAMGMSMPGKQYVLDEFVIMGGEAVVPRVEDFGFFDKNGGALYSYSNTDEITVKATVFNVKTDLITACYDENSRLRMVSVKKGVFSENGNKLTDTIKTQLLGSNWKVKVFLFNIEGNMKPSAEKITLPENSSEIGRLSPDVGNDEVVYDVTKGYNWVTAGEEKSDFTEDAAALFDGKNKTTLSVSSDEDIKAVQEIHFKDVMQITQVNVFAKCAKASSMSEYSVYASMDGVSYEYVNTVENEYAESGIVRKYTLDIKGILYAKDLKLVMKKASGKSAMEIAEVNVYGRPPQLTKDRAVNYIYETAEPFPTDADIIGEDGGMKLLSDNDMTAVQSSGEYVSVIYDLGDYCQVEDVVVYGSHGGMELLQSPDGVSYFSSGFYTETNGETKAWGKSENNSKYVKLVFRKGSKDKIMLKEIKLYTRKLYERSAENIEKIPVKCTVKPNNILCLDWTGFAGNEDKEYKVFIEKNNFGSISNKMISKAVFVNGSEAKKSKIKGQYCLYAGLEPNQTYYVAVTDNTAAAGTAVTPTKIQTYSALGGETLAGMFCINEYIYGGAENTYQKHENESENLEKKRKLISDMEVFSKTRYWQDEEPVLNKYFSRGVSFHQYARNTEQVKKLNEYGIYSFAHMNEPEIQTVDGVSGYYNKNPDKFVPLMQDIYGKMRAAGEKNLLAEPAICGTAFLGFIDGMYQADSNLGNYYDVMDVHAYCKKIEGERNMDGDGIDATSESHSVPEHVFAKMQRIKNVMSKYGDDKPIIFTEIGWSTHKDTSDVNCETVTKIQQANYTARCYLVSALCGIENVFLYAFQDSRPTDEEAEYQYGIVDWYGVPKPAYYSYYTVGRILKNAKLVKRIDKMEHPNYGAIFYDSEKNMYVTALWNINGGDKVKISTRDESIQKIGIFGESEYVSSSDELQIGSAPIYLYTSDIPEIL